MGGWASEGVGGWTGVKGECGWVRGGRGTSLQVVIGCRCDDLSTCFAYGGVWAGREGEGGWVGGCIRSACF